MAGGRQLEFDKNKALNDAMLVFWKKGFFGASLSELTNSMGINKPSMYATFGNKEKLFIQAIEHYIENYAVTHVKHLAKPGRTLKQRLLDYMMSVVAGQCDITMPKGCYISLCVSESASDSIPSDAMAIIESARDFNERFLTQFFVDEINASHLPPETDAGEMALFVVTLLHGTAAMARGGKTVKELTPIFTGAISRLDFIENT